MILGNNYINLDHVMNINIRLNRTSQGKSIYFKLTTDAKNAMAVRTNGAEYTYVKEDNNLWVQKKETLKIDSLLSDLTFSTNQIVTYTIEAIVNYTSELVEKVPLEFVFSRHKLCSDNYKVNVQSLEEESKYLELLYTKNKKALEEYLKPYAEKYLPNNNIML